MGRGGGKVVRVGGARERGGGAHSFPSISVLLGTSPLLLRQLSSAVLLPAAAVPCCSLLAAAGKGCHLPAVAAELRRPVAADVWRMPANAEWRLVAPAANWWPTAAAPWRLTEAAADQWLLAAAAV